MFADRTVEIKIDDLMHRMVKFIYSEKATKFCKIFNLLLSYVVPVKSKVEISQNFVAFSEYMNFNKLSRISLVKKIIECNYRGSGTIFTDFCGSNKYKF